MISVLDPKREVGLWHSVLTVSTYTTLKLPSHLIDSERRFVVQLSINLNFYFQNVMNGMHVIYVPPSVLKNSPAMWLQMVTKHRGTRVCARSLYK